MEIEHTVSKVEKKVKEISLSVESFNNYMGSYKDILRSDLSARYHYRPRDRRLYVSSTSDTCDRRDRYDVQEICAELIKMLCFAPLTESI